MKITVLAGKQTVWASWPDLARRTSSFGHSSQSTDLRVVLSPSAVVVVIFLRAHRTPSRLKRTTRLSTTVLLP